MANTAPKVHDRNFAMRVDETFFDEIDEIRSMMQPIPSKSEAVRIAVRNELLRLRSRRAGLARVED